MTPDEAAVERVARALHADACARDELHAQLIGTMRGLTEARAEVARLREALKQMRAERDTQAQMHDEVLKTTGDAIDTEHSAAHAAGFREGVEAAAKEADSWDEIGAEHQHPWLGSEIGSSIRSRLLASAPPAPAAAREADQKQ